VKKLTLQPQGSGHVAGAVAGKGPDERLLRRLGSDLAVVKKRLDEIAPPKDPGALMMMRDGDHAMLAGKPLQGYRYSKSTGIGSRVIVMSCLHASMHVTDTTSCKEHFRVRRHLTAVCICSWSIVATTKECCSYP
jgi:hypothetical protein